MHTADGPSMLQSVWHQCKWIPRCSLATHSKLHRGSRPVSRVVTVTTTAATNVVKCTISRWNVPRMELRPVCSSALKHSVDLKSNHQSEGSDHCVNGKLHNALCPMSIIASKVFFWMSVYAHSVICSSMASSLKIGLLEELHMIIPSGVDDNVPCSTIPINEVKYEEEFES